MVSCQALDSNQSCVGLIKNRFPYLHVLNVNIKNLHDVKKVVQILNACVILCNLLLSELDIPEDMVMEDFLYGGDEYGVDEDIR